MKKKNYLHKVEKGVLISTSALLLNGLASCSDSPTDMMPESLQTKGASGLPGEPGLPGLNVPYYPAGTVPTLGAGVKGCFNMTENTCSFRIILPKGYQKIKVYLYNEQSSPRQISDVIIKYDGGYLPNARWQQMSGGIIEITSIRVASHPTLKDQDVGITLDIRSQNTKLLYLFADYSN